MYLRAASNRCWIELPPLFVRAAIAPMIVRFGGDPAFLPMNNEETGAALPQGVSWVFAVLAGIFAAFVLFLVGEVLHGVTPHNETIAYFAYAIVAVATTFYICRAYPSSRWHAPLLCNAPGVLAACLEPAFWRFPTWPIVVAGWALTLVATALGSSHRRSASEAQPMHAESDTAEQVR